MSQDLDRGLDEALGALAAESAGRGAPERVEAALRREFRRRRRRQRAPWWAAAAAVVALAVLLAALRPGRPAAPQAEAASGRVQTEFIPIAHGQPFRLEEGGRIVRVRMPRTALASFGLPVNQERLSEGIQADVLLGEDNLVRAIRFEQ
jgi:ferric-dicitrate binding protein FerR (iron transport regulator)